MFSALGAAACTAGVGHGAGSLERETEKNKGKHSTATEKRNSQRPCEGSIDAAMSWIMQLLRYGSSRKSLEAKEQEGRKKLAGAAGRPGLSFCLFTLRIFPSDTLHLEHMPNL
jgi:hypothetical protein